jgi:hypothetical protein
MMNFFLTLVGRDASFTFPLFKNPTFFYFTALSYLVLVG